MEIIMGNGVQELLEMLYSLIREAKSLPLSSDKCVLERDRALDIIDEMKAQFPTELAEAKRLVDARAEFISNAKREADTIKKAAEERAKQLVNEQEIYKTAKARSTELMASTERNTNAVSYTHLELRAKAVKPELDIRGMMTDEAIPVVERFIDSAKMAKLNTVTIIHGKGTGALRQAVHDCLRRERGIKSFRLGRYGEGETGVTVVELK